MTADRPTRESLEYLDGPSWVRAPTLVIPSDDDPRVPQSTSKKAGLAVLHARAVIPPGAEGKRRGSRPSGQSRERFVEPIEAVTGPAASKKADLGADAIAALLAQRPGSRVSQVTLQTQPEIR